MPGLRDNKLLHLHGHGLWPELVEHGVRYIGGELFNQPPFAAFAQLQQPASDGEIIHRVRNAVAGGGGSEVGFHFHRQQEALQYLDRVEFIPVRSPRAMRGFLKGINTAVPRDKDRV